MVKKDTEVARLFYRHNEEYTWEMAFSQVYTEYADLDDIKKMVANCKKGFNEQLMNTQMNIYI